MSEEVNTSRLNPNTAGEISGNDHEPLAHARTRSIHSVLSNADSVRIFALATEGIDASTSVLQKYNFTKKRYYGRLKELVDLGLVFKDHGAYRHTRLGSLVFANQVESLEGVLSNEQDSVSLSNPNDTTRSQILSAVMVSTTEPKKFGFFESWEELSMHVAMTVENMSRDVYAATRYFDFRTAETALRAARRGCKVNILHSDRDGISTKLQVVGNLMSHPKAASVYIELTNSPNIVMAEATVPYSFIVIDGRTVGIEIVNPEDPYSFFFGLEFENETFASKLISQFHEISKRAEEGSIKSVIQSDRTILSAKPPQMP